MNTKKWWESTTVWIGIATVLTGMLPLVMDLLEVLSPESVTVAGAIVAFLLGMIQIIRRVALDPSNEIKKIEK